MASERTHLSIGEVLTLLQPEFPDITISKIRFLESQGLLDPERTPSGYRKFHDPDIERLRWILTQQRDHFLPLKVIKDRLNSGDLSGTGDGVLPLGGEPSTDPGGSSAEATEGTTRARSRRAHSDEPATGTDPGNGKGKGKGTGSVEADPSGADTPAAEPSAASEDAGPTTTGVGDDATGGGSAAVPTAAGPAEPAEPTHREGTSAEQVAEPAGAAGPGAEAPGAPSDDDPGATPGPGDGGGAATEGPAPSNDPEPGSSRRALTLLKRAGVVPPDASAPAPSSGGDDHDRARNVARLVEAPAEAAADPVTRGRRRHPTGHTPGEPVPPPEPDQADRPEPLEPASSVSLSLEELSAASGLSPRELGELERYGLLTNRTLGTVRYYDDEALVVARLAAGFGRYGIEPRHLRMYKVAAEREAGLFEQLITPLLKQRRASARQEAVEVLEELAELADDLRAAMVRSALRDYLGRA